MKHAEKIRLVLPLVLPDVTHPQDQCIDKLIQSLSGRPGLERVHLKQGEFDELLLCLHYVPALITVARLRELVHSVGADLTEKYGHYTTRINLPLHARSARLLSSRLRGMPGVLEAEVSASARFASNTNATCCRKPSWRNTSPQLGEQWKARAGAGMTMRQVLPNLQIRTLLLLWAPG